MGNWPICGNTISENSFNAATFSVLSQKFRGISAELMGRVFANDTGDLGSISGHVIPKTLKMVLDTSFLNTQQYKVLSRVKWSNPGKGVAPSLHLGVVAIKKGAFWLPLTAVANFIHHTTNL